ncbi:L,D-transpeptidase family protein [Rhodoferax sp.]|uniref:L,D-transpeptidase family protein n=1 Tax=Rhodoferax sp. TaxID=50421 RepID=UPI0025D03ADA|nr:L,D-transpeptidase family protein [Rhodoferax sp.]
MACGLLLAQGDVFSKTQEPVRILKAQSNKAPQPNTLEAGGVAEARLIEIYTLIGRGDGRAAFEKAEQLVSDLPNFQLAQLVYGDLLVARTRPVSTLGDVPPAMAKEASAPLKDLREESLRRVKALRERPQKGTIPSQFLQLSPTTRHAIAVDASRSRLYLFENTPSGLELVADYYISVGKAGISKNVEGDQRTPLGVYYITSNLDPKSLKDFYGSGALPISYPNVLDSKRGKTGSGIWLHGTPPAQFSRAPLATDGCVVLANPDLEHIIRTVAIRATPVVIAQQLQWVSANTVKNTAKGFESALLAWRNAKTAGNAQQVLDFYTSDFNSNGKSLSQWTPVLRGELEKTKGRTIQLKDVSFLQWIDHNETMVATFGEVAEGSRIGWTKRQYWTHVNGQWKIFYEGLL